MKDRRRLARQVLEACGAPVRGDGDLEPIAERMRARGRLHRRLAALGAALLLTLGPASIAGELPGPGWLGLAGTLAGVMAALVAPHLLPDRNFAGELAGPLLERDASPGGAALALSAPSPGGQMIQSQRKALQLDEETVERLAGTSGEVGRAAAEVHRKWRRFELFRGAVVAGLGGLLVHDVWTGTDATWAVVTAAAILLAMWLGLERARERAVAALAPRLDGG